MGGARKLSFEDDVFFETAANGGSIIAVFWGTPAAIIGMLFNSSFPAFAAMKVASGISRALQFSTASVCSSSGSA